MCVQVIEKECRIARLDSTILDKRTCAPKCGCYPCISIGTFLSQTTDLSLSVVMHVLLPMKDHLSCTELFKMIKREVDTPANK